jgi:hypothetical protein
MEGLRDGRISSESTVLSYNFLAFPRLSVIANLIMCSPTDYEHLLETRKNGKLYCLYKLKTLPEEYDASAVTYLISTIESFHQAENESSPVFFSTTVSDTFFNVGEYVCVQIVAPEGTIPKERCMYWAKGSNLITGTIILSNNEDLPYDDAHIYGNFEDNVHSMYSRTFLMHHTNNLPFRPC